MSEFLKETDKLLGKAVKSINDNLFTDTDKDVNEQKEEKESSTSQEQEEVEKPTQKKTTPSTTERLKSIEEKEPSILEELKDTYKEEGREFLLELLGTPQGILILLCVIAFILLWIFAGFGWAVAVVILGLVIWAATWIFKKMM